MTSAWIGRRFLSSVRAAAFLFPLLLGCGGTQPAPPPSWTTWADEDRRCTADIAACVSRCDTEQAAKAEADGQGETPTCDLVLVDWVEGNEGIVKWRSDHGLASLDAQAPGSLDLLRERVHGICKRGEARGCRAEEAVSARMNGTTPRTDTASSTNEQAVEIIRRAAKAKDRANAAVSLDGTDNANNIKDDLASCTRSRSACVNAAEAEQRSLVGAYAGLAVYLANLVPDERNYSHDSMANPARIVAMEPNIARAEQLAEQAEREAKKAAASKREASRAVDDEADVMIEAKRACDTDASVCKQRCDGGNQPYCVQVGVRAWKAVPPRLSEAKAVLEKACKAEVKTACTLMDPLTKDIQTFDARADELWGLVTDAVDDIARKRNLIALARKRAAPTAVNVGGFMRADANLTAYTLTTYCPAVNNFLGHAGAAEFRRRAKMKCTDDQAPTGMSDNNDEVFLSSQCRAVLATSCPAPPKPVARTGPPQGDFVPECAGGHLWMFRGPGQCQCGVTAADPCASRGCTPMFVQDGTCRCSCGGN